MILKVTPESAFPSVLVYCSVVTREHAVSVTCM